MNKQISLEEYKKLSKEFNKLSFVGKIKTIIEKSDLLVIAMSYKLENDLASWSIKVKDKEIQKQLEDSGVSFEIDKEWSWGEMIDFLEVLGIPAIDAKDFPITERPSKSKKTEDSEDVVPKYYWPV